MHRSDRALADRIEMAFISNGLTPVQCIEFDGAGACALGAVGVRSGGIAAMERQGAKILGVSRLFARGIWQGFDQYDAHDEYDDIHSCVLDCYHTAWHIKRSKDRFNQYSRGFRVGWIVAKRMFSKAPVEVVNNAVLVTI